MLPGYSLQRISKPGQMLCSWAHDGSTSEAVAFINDGDSTVAQNECLGEDPLAGLGQQACQHEEIGKLGPTEHLVTVQWLSANGHHYSVMAGNDHPQPDLLARTIAAARAIESRLG